MLLGPGLAVSSPRIRGRESAVWSLPSVDWNTAKTIAETMEATITSLALVVGAIWTYRRFIRQREPYPRASVSHTVQQVFVGTNRRLLHIEATLTNSGQTLIRLERFRTWLQQVQPLVSSLAAQLHADQDLVPECAQEVPWPLLEKREKTWERGAAEVEPGEGEMLSSDFIIDASIEVVQVYTYVWNHHKPGREIGWARTTFLCLDSKGAHVMPTEPSSPRREEKQMPPRVIPPRVPTEPLTPMPQVPPRDEPPPVEPPPVKASR